MNMEQQYKKEQTDQLIEGMATLTGIPESTYKQQGIKFMLENPDAVEGLTRAQRKKLTALKEFAALWNEVEFLNEDTAINTSEKAGQYFHARLKCCAERERFEVALLNSQNKLIATKTLFEGTINESPVYPREIARAALNHNAQSVILAHNHPGGSLKPSAADITVTQNVVRGLKAIGIHVVDHIIVSFVGYASMAELGSL